MKKKVLIIKLSSLGDMVQATPAFNILRERHKNDELILLTSYIEFAKKLNIFDKIIKEERSRGISFLSSLFNVCKIKPDITYDLQGVDRTKIYMSFLRGKKWKLGNEPHSQDRLKGLLGIYNLPELDLTKYKEHIEIPKAPYCLIIPCASLKRKLWPNYSKLCIELLKKRILPVIIGGNDTEFSEIDGILNLCGKTSWFQIVTLAMNAICAVGNDTGPLFLASAGLCKTIAIHDPLNPKERGGHKGRNHKIFDFSITVPELLKEMFDVKNEDM